MKIGQTRTPFIGQSPKGYPPEGCFSLDGLQFSYSLEGKALTPCLRWAGRGFFRAHVEGPWASWAWL